MSRILVVDDEEKMRHLLSIMLKTKEYEVDEAGDGREALGMVDECSYDMIITDIKMPRMDGVELLNRIKERKIPCPVVFITAFATIESAVEAMRQGAVDYITKPFEEDRILLTVERTLNLSRLMAENRELRQQLQTVAGDDEIIYVSREMSLVMDLASRVAASETAVLITGESGTGKELLAKYIHKTSPRNEKRFVPVNCAAISSNLVESELFGHEKGSFTNADKKAVGKFEYASGGTIFLDEIGDLPMEAQAKLLRTLQEKKIQRVGGNEEIPVDIRLICATNQDLEQLVESHCFRQDLFFRINVFPIQPPPLRERMDDVVPLARHFLKRMAGSRIHLSKDAEITLMNYNWPGNVRELSNAIERSAILEQDSKTITRDSLCFLKSVTCQNLESGFRLPADGISLENFEKQMVKQALETTGNNQSAAAKLLGLSRAKFRVLMKQTLKE
jgi:DNA-binding NtrC family response regulator